MGIKAKFSKEFVRNSIKGQMDKIKDDIFNIFSYVGEEFIKNARIALNIDSGAFPKGDYTDRTAVLRSSLGYFILYNGKILKRNLKGNAKGKDAALSVLSDVPKLNSGYQLIGVAGADYASYLESMGYNVITSQADVALVDLSKMLKSYASKKGFDFDIEYTGVMVQMR